MFDLVIRGTTTDIGIEDQYIVAIAADLPAGKREIDAKGLTILPGLIDVHLHFNEPGRADWEGAATGSRALAAGGGTLFFDMPLNSSPCTVGAPEFDLKRAALEASSVTDFALWGGIIPGNRGALADLADRGVIGFKAFMCDSCLPEFPRADDLTLYEGMRESARLNLPVAVHAESEEITKALSKRMVESDRRDIPAFLESRPVIAEVEAINRAGLLARETGCRLHVVHISSGRGVAAALEARALGTDISLETCPHYLLFTEDDLLRIGAFAKCTPPLRNRGESNALFDCVKRGEIDMVASDHSPCPPDMKQNQNFFGIWGGIAGVQWTRSALIEKGLDLSAIASLTGFQCSRRFNILNKGTIKVGKHADLAVVDPAAVQTVHESSLFQRHRTTPYMGLSLHGVTRHTIRRGDVIFSGGAITATTKGSFVRPGI